MSICGIALASMMLTIFPGSGEPPYTVIAHTPTIDCRSGAVIWESGGKKFLSTEKYLLQGFDIADQPSPAKQRFDVSCFVNEEPILTESSEVARSFDTVAPGVVIWESTYKLISITNAECQFDQE